MNPLAGKRVILWGAPQNGLDELGENLIQLGLQVHVAHSIEDVRTAILTEYADLIVARLCGCFQDPLELLAWLKQVPAGPPVLTVSEGMDVKLYLEAMRRGAFDCVGMPLNESELVRIVVRALEARQAEAVATGGMK